MKRTGIYIGLVFAVAFLAGLVFSFPSPPFDDLASQLYIGFTSLMALAVYACIRLLINSYKK